MSGLIQPDDKPGYDFFILDLYGTLVDIHTDESSPAFWEQISMFFRYNGADWTWADLQRSYNRTLSLQFGECSYTHWPEIPLEDIFSQLYRAKGVIPDEYLIRHTTLMFRVSSTKYIRLYDDTIRVLEALQSAGKKLYLLSNAQGGFTRPELASLGIDHYFQELFISSEKGRCKPDPEFLHELIHSEGIKPAAAVLIGNDLTTDIQVAESCGIDSVYLHTNHSRDEWLDQAASHAKFIVPDGSLSTVLKLIGNIDQ
ncbi:HAD family hydrolase [Spirochaeta dissipatitropha]